MRDLVTGQVRGLPVPEADRDIDVAWLGDARTVIATATTTRPAPNRCPPPTLGCPTEPPPRTAHAYQLDLDTAAPPTWRRLPALDGALTWAEVQLLSPLGQSSSYLQVLVRDPDGAEQPAARTLATVDLPTGTVVQSVLLPPGRRPMSTDISGTQFLLSGPNRTERWTPGDQPVRIGPYVPVAAW